jgi:hypothetical protein
MAAYFVLHLVNCSVLNLADYIVLFMAVHSVLFFVTTLFLAQQTALLSKWQIIYHPRGRLLRPLKENYCTTADPGAPILGLESAQASA